MLCVRKAFWAALGGLLGAGWQGWVVYNVDDVDIAEICPL